MLILSRKINEKICIGGNITLTIIDVKGDQVKVGVEAPKEVKVFRQEVYDAIQKENKAAAALQNVAPENLSALNKLIKKQLGQLWKAGKLCGERKPIFFDKTGFLSPHLSLSQKNDQRVCHSLDSGQVSWF